MQGKPDQRVGAYRSHADSSQDLVETSEENLLRILQVKGDLLQACPGIMVEVSQRLSASCQEG